MKSSNIKEFVCSLGADTCGIANIERFCDAPEGFHPKDIFPDAKSVIVIGKQNPKGLFSVKTNVPYTLVRNKLFELLDNISFSLTYKLEGEGYTAIPIPAGEPYEFWDAENRHGRGILSLKHAGQLAGLGRIGKNTLLAGKKYGNRLWLGAVITDMVLEPDTMAEKLCPENCRICIEACPKSALDGITIDQKKCREICASVTEGGGLIYSCNICRKVCPFSKV